MNLRFPQSFEDRMRLSLADDWENFSSAHEKEAPVSIRINPAKRTHSAGDNVPWAAQGTYLNRRPVFTLDPSFHAGAYYVQEASSMFLEQAVRQSVDLSRPLRVLDLCAAPAGKSTHLLSLIHPDSLLVANEVIHSRATILSENLTKWGHVNVVVTNSDPEDFQRLSGYFDLIIVDAPCSGEGLFRKDPKATLEWSLKNVSLCAQRQKRILQDVWPALRQNGILVYCTCTYNEEENEDNLIWLVQHGGAESIELKTQPAWNICGTRKGNISAYRFYPHRLRGEGFFIAAVRKTKDEVPVKTKSKSTLVTLPRKTTDQLREWLTGGEPYHFILQKDLVLMIRSDHIREIEMLTEKLRVINKGTAWASLKHEKLIPEHAAAMSVALRKEFFTQVHLENDPAVLYLRKESVRPDHGKRGFALVIHNDLPLGWVNLLDNRVNNLYPSAWRIRMGS
jgi:16S rRNA C967 or C1407 C5-methylase (RsmB/RsmF family)/NOL1/NOP2/fmu family ribosome biogenesis protein